MLRHYAASLEDLVLFVPVWPLRYPLVLLSTILAICLGTALVGVSESHSAPLYE